MYQNYVREKGVDKVMVFDFLKYLGVSLFLDDIKDFPKLKNPEHGFCHHWAIGAALVAGSLLGEALVRRFQRSRR